MFQHLPVREKNRSEQDEEWIYHWHINICWYSRNRWNWTKSDWNIWRWIFRENFKISPFKKVIEKLFALRQNIKDEKNDLMQRLVKLSMNSLYGNQIRRDINESYYRKSETWMKTGFDGNVLD